MLKITETKVDGFESAIRALRNPFSNWDASDSGEDFAPEIGPYFSIGPSDYTLMERLALAGPDHGKVLRFINCSFDLLAPMYFLKQWDTYKFNNNLSTSTMHSISDKAFDVSDFSHEHLHSALGSLEITVRHLNNLRTRYLETKDKEYWYEMIQLLPSSYNQKRTVSTNYASLRNMYQQRKGHKLDEWQQFCRWAETLPYKNLIVGTRANEK